MRRVGGVAWTARVCAPVVDLTSVAAVARAAWLEMEMAVIPFDPSRRRAGADMSRGRAENMGSEGQALPDPDEELRRLPMGTVMSHG
jgi:hypothetical protein